MTYAIAIAVFLVLPAVVAAARIAAYYRHGAHGRPDLESGHTGDLSSAASVAYNNAIRQARAQASGSPARAEDHRPTLRPVFNLGATPVAAGVSPWASDEHIRREFDLDTPDHRGQAA